MKHQILALIMAGAALCAQADNEYAIFRTTAGVHGIPAYELNSVELSVDGKTIIVNAIDGSQENIDRASVKSLTFAKPGELTDTMFADNFDWLLAPNASTDPTVTSYEGDYKGSLWQSLGYNAPAWSWSRDYVYGRPGLIKLGKTDYCGDIMTPELTALGEMANDVTISFKAVASIMGSTSTFDSNALYVAVIGDGEVENADSYINVKTSFYKGATLPAKRLTIDNFAVNKITASWYNSDHDIWGDNARFSVNIKNATKHTRIAFFAGGINTDIGKRPITQTVLTDEKGTSHAAKISGNINRIFLDEVKITADPTAGRPADKVELSTYAHVSVPDRTNMNIKGSVFCGNVPLAGVAVSDGVQFAVTDENGFYYMNSDKKYGYVFVSTPKGFRPPSDGVYPAYFAYTCSDANTCEQINFEMLPDNDQEYVVMALADTHLANQRNDLKQFTSWMVPDINNLIADYRSQGKRVYGITLGDQSWDQYWYDNKFDIWSARPYFEMLDFDGLYHCTGNHDNDGYVADDFGAAEKYRTTFGPSNYSFNIGEIHYIVLDNIEYINTGGAQGKLGSRNYNCTIGNDVLEWVREDLALVQDKTAPVVVCMHCPWLTHAGLTGSAENEATFRSDFKAAQALYNCFEDFTDVRALTGHSHINHVRTYGKLTDYNVAAVCATWWYTGQSAWAKNHVAKDGSFGGYRVMEVNGRDIYTYYKSLGHDADYQFRAYDLNECNITVEKYCPKAGTTPYKNFASQVDQFNEMLRKLGQYGSTEYYDDGTPKTPNRILVNVWAASKNWKVQMFEGDTELHVVRLRRYDPLFLISSPCKRLNEKRSNNILQSGLLTGGLYDHCNPTNTAPMFMATAKSATSTITIKVTDDYGNVHTQIMERPKALTTTMY